MLINEQKEQLGNILEELGKTLDISETQFNAAVQSYEAVAEQLSKKGSLLEKYNPKINPQGSFLLGTMIKPIHEDDDIDIDLICELHGKNTLWTQKDLKNNVGFQLEENDIYKTKIKIKNGRRCWTLYYRETSNSPTQKYHLDILPSIVNSNYINLLSESYLAIKENIDNIAIRITDKERRDYESETDHNQWLKSNPIGYGKWFFYRANIGLNQKKHLSESISPVPKFEKEKLPLQRIVQILKRHRDIMFEGDDNKPISIIITTLAAHSYEQTSNFYDALINVINKMDNFIIDKYSSEHKREIKWIANPVNPQENFADKWVEEKIKQDNFYDWLEKLKEDFNQLFNKTLKESYSLLKASFGTLNTNQAFLNKKLETIINESFAFPTAYSPSLLMVPHRQKPEWVMRLSNYVEIFGRYKHKNKWKSITPQTKIPKNCDIIFTGRTNVTKPFEVYWQVVNTGNEAKDNLRGGIFHSNTLGVGGLSQKEKTLYKGIHWIECFIVKNHICVAKSNEFFVDIE